MVNLLLTLLPLFLLATVASASLLVSIDCGASNSHTDENGIKWVADTSYIQNGESRVVKTSNSIPESMKTLRVFTSRKKNCYPIEVKGGEQILVRASFNYGNYDGKSSPPSFELLFDGNSWATVETTMDGEVYYEVVYVVTGDGTSVCVAQSMPDQLPFVSAIEVWELEPDMYGHYDPRSALSLYSRVAFGAPGIVRYPDDAYDRIWDPSAASNALTVLNSDATTIDTNATDNPPAAVLQTAVTPSDPSNFIVLLTNLPANPVQIYINLYFAEMTQLSSTDTRSFAIFLDGDQLSDPITPVYGTVSEYYITNLTASGSTQFALKATADSTLPPIINAMEVFSVSDALSNGTDGTDGESFWICLFRKFTYWCVEGLSKDACQVLSTWNLPSDKEGIKCQSPGCAPTVEGLATLMRQFNVLQDWSGDPCLPVSYNWDWVGCSSDDTPRITALYLNGLGLSGELPDFSAMDALETIDVHNNSISGGIPEFLGNLPNLKELNLADNSFSGPVPSSLSNNNKIKLVTSGNPNLCASGQSCETFSTSNSPGTTKSHTSSVKNKKKSNLGLILGLTIPLTFVAIVVSGVMLFLRTRRGAAPVAAVSPGGPMKSPGKPGTPPSKPRIQPRAQGSTGSTCSWQSILELDCIGYNIYQQSTAILTKDDEKSPEINGDGAEDDIEQQAGPESVNAEREDGEEEVFGHGGTYNKKVRTSHGNTKKPHRNSGVSHGRNATTAQRSPPHGRAEPARGRDNEPMADDEEKDFEQEIAEEGVDSQIVLEMKREEDETYEGGYDRNA